MVYTACAQGKTVNQQFQAWPKGLPGRKERENTSKRGEKSQDKEMSIRAPGRINLTCKSEYRDI